MIPEAGRPRRAEGVEAHESAGTTLLRDAEGTPLCSLNETALALWQLCDGETSVGEMVDAVCEACAIPAAVAAADIRETLVALERAGVVVLP